MGIFNKLYICILVIASAVILFFTADSFSITSSIVPERIAVNSLYHGSRIVISGETEADRDIILKISSPEVQTNFHKKGKAGGVLWMNIGGLEFNPVPYVYLIYTTKDINSMLSESQRDVYVIGYDAFRRHVNVSPAANDAEKENWLGEFIKFKEKEKVYGVFPGTVEIKNSGDKTAYNLFLDWPYEAPPMEYTISVYAVKDGAITDSTEKSLVVEKTGLLKFLSDMAFNHEIIYGIISIIIAVVAGFIVSLLFKGKSGVH